MSKAPRTLIKAHVADDDVMVIVDPLCTQELTRDDVALMCERRSGVGADLVVRLTRTASMPGGENYLESAPQAQWFMDAYGPDGQVRAASLAGVLACAHVLVDRDLVPASDADEIHVGTRAGVCVASRHEGVWTCESAPIVAIDADMVREHGGWDTRVSIPGLDGVWAGVRVNTPQSWLVIAVPSADDADEIRRAFATAAALECDPVRGQATSVALVAGMAAAEDVDEAQGRDEAEGHYAVHVLRTDESAPTSWLDAVCASAVAVGAWEQSTGDDGRALVMHTPHGWVGVSLEGQRVDLTKPTTVMVTAAPEVTATITLAH